MALKFWIVIRSVLQCSVQTNSGICGEKLVSSQGNIFFVLRGYEIIGDNVFAVVVGYAATGAVSRRLR